MNSIVPRMLALACIMTSITMAVGLAAYYGAAYFHMQIMMRHMPAPARAELTELTELIEQGKRASPRYFELFEHYGSESLDVGDASFMLGIACISILAGWTCFRKVESFPEVKGELDDEATTIYEGI